MKKISVALLGLAIVFFAFMGVSCSNSGNTGKAESGNVAAEAEAEKEPGAVTGEDKAAAKKEQKSEAPPFARIVLRDLEGKPSKLEKLAGGKPVYVAFFLSGGGPCMAQVPRINEIHGKYSEKGLAVLGASAQDPKDKIAAARDKWGMKYPLRVYYMNDNIEYFKLSAVPLNIVFDAHGNLVYKHRMPPPDSLLEMLLSS